MSAETDTGAKGGGAPGSSPADKFRYEYGAQPLNFLATAASLFVCAYAILRITEIPGGAKVLIWLAIAAVLHDLVALPLYSVFLRVADGTATSAIKSRPAALLALNHVRVPVAISALMLVVFFPLILRIDPESYLATTGLTLDSYLGRWLLISAALFVISGIVYAIRLRRGEGDVEKRTSEPSEVREVAPALGTALRIGAGVVLTGTALVIGWSLVIAIGGLLESGLGL